MITALRRALEDLVLPELPQIAPHQREPAMKRVGEEPFVFLEWVGMLLGLIITAWMTRYGASGLEAGTRVALVAANFLLALPIVLSGAAGEFLDILPEGQRREL
ncbi:MAG: hypothetical protein F9K29_16665 [Hyphomicrobiaceae bacterium]|nr:MAG: hypothetical protein F9K29_16665 [Hyphomicrobiaceae bacterium]